MTHEEKIEMHRLFDEGLTYQEIAKKTNLKVGHIRYHLDPQFKALVKQRAKVSKQKHRHGNNNNSGNITEVS